jgi:uncharacterized protein YqeY
MIKQQLQSDQIAALKAGDKAKLNVLRYIVAQIKNKEIDSRRDLTDEEVIQILRKQVKELQEANEGFVKGGRQDLVDENNSQIAIISAYLPAELSDEQLEAEMDKLIADNQEAIQKNPKSIIGICMNALRSKAAPARISALLKQKNLL